MTKRTYRRRTAEERIAELEAEIEKQKGKIAAREKADDPVLRDVPKLLKRLKAFAQTAHDHGRADIANTTTGYLTALERFHRGG